MQKITIEVRGFHKDEARGALENALGSVKGIKSWELDNPNKQVIIIAEDDVNPRRIKDVLAGTDFSVGTPKTEPYNG